jgi:ABC-type nitrate/sulfonate/bicarbonate transport system substrate-binding protein
VTQTATPYLIQAVLRGSDAVGIASETANPIYSLTVKPEIASFADLKGRVLGLSLPIDTISISMRKLLALKGLGDADYRVKELVGTPVRFECLRRGECDGVPLGQPDDLIALTQGYRRLGLSTEAVSAFQFQLLAVKRSWAAANKDTLVRFVRAIASSFRFIRDPANRAEVIKTMVAVTGSTEDIAGQTLSLYFEPDRGVMPKQAEFSIAGLAQVIAFMGDGGMLAQPLPPPERFVDPQYLKVADWSRAATFQRPFPLPWRRPTAHPSRRGSNPVGACLGRPAPARSSRNAARISDWRREAWFPGPHPDAAPD